MKKTTDDATKEIAKLKKELAGVRKDLDLTMRVVTKIKQVIVENTKMAARLPPNLVGRSCDWP